jgi:hypothetical protein
MSPPAPGTLDDVADRLYGLHPDEFVPARDDAVAEARQAGDRDLARAIARLRRPTRAAWLANLLARERSDQLDGLLALADDLASAQRTLDGGALRALSAQRNRLVTAMAREGGRLAAQAGDSATESVVRDLAGILDAALADPDVADEVRSGRLTRTVSYSGFGPGPGGGGGGRPATDGARPGGRSAGGGGAGETDRADRADDEQADKQKDSADDERAARERAERERIERERAERQRAVEEAERAADDARDRQESAEAEKADADSAHEAAKAQVADLAAELEAARERERSAAATARAATATARDAAREASTAAARADRARGRLAELDSG